MRAFMERNGKELLRDPVSGIFCLGFPLIMLVIMSVVNGSIPPEAHMTIFQIQQLCPGVAVFSFSFTMLLAALIVSRDRSTALLWRLRASPLRSWDYLLGYLCPLLLLTVGQLVICVLASQLVAVLGDGAMSGMGLLRMGLSLIPAMVLMVSVGILLGALLPEKAAPGVSSILISVSSILSGVWMDVDGLGGGIRTISGLLPFYHCVKVGRLALSGASGMARELGVCGLWGAAACVAACLLLRYVLKKDL